MAFRMGLFVLATAFFLPGSAAWAFCFDDSDCYLYLTCENNECVGELDFCTSDNDCGEGEICEADACVVALEPATWTCDDLERTSDFRLCDVYCLALDCQGQPNESASACDTLSDLLLDRTGLDTEALVCVL